MLYCFLVIFMGVIVALDQYTKALVAAHIPVGQTVPALPGVFHLAHLHNTGAAFSMLEGGRWFFALIFAAGIVMVIVLIKKKVITAPFELWCLAAIFGGGAGNLVDRIRLAYVVDMFEVEFMNFAVFNVADIFITCGAVALFVYALFFDKKEKKHDPAA